MSKLNFIKYQSLSKIGTVAGIISGALVGSGNRLVTDLFAITGTIVGAFISRPAFPTCVTSNEEQLVIVKNHFNGSIADIINPLETNYNLYERDVIGNVIGCFERFFAMNKNPTEGEPTNKIISTKYILLDTFNDIRPEEVALDIMPIITVLTLNKLSSKSIFASIFDTLLIYSAKPAVNYILYKGGNLHDYEELELQFNQDEIDDFKSCLPQELYLEIDRVSL
jgi:hypothetical protein